MKTAKNDFTRRVLKIFGVSVLALVFLAACFGLFAVEFNLVMEIHNLRVSQDITPTIEADKIDPFYDGKLVHLTAFADTEAICTDEIFRVTEEKAIKLVRLVEMYQWMEKKHTSSGGSGHSTTTYSHSKIWSSEVINSNRFARKSGHQNPNKMKYPSIEVTALHVRFGAFKLHNGLVDKITFSSRRNMEQKDYDNLPKDLKKEIKLMGGLFYFGNSLGNPMIGDTKVSFWIVKPMEISIVARQSNDTLVPHDSEMGTIALVEPGKVSTEAMYKSAEKRSYKNIWAIRLGLGGLIIGMLAPIIAIYRERIKKLPVIGKLGTYSVTFTIIVLVVVIAMIIQAIANVRFFIIKAIILYTASVVIFGLAYLFARRKVNKGIQHES